MTVVVGTEEDAEDVLDSSLFSRSAEVGIVPFLFLTFLTCCQPSSDGLRDGGGGGSSPPPPGGAVVVRLSDVSGMDPLR
jgi:hypothetical protein